MEPLRKTEENRHQKKVKPSGLERWIRRGKKALIGCVVFLFIIGLAAVDGSYAEMMQKEGVLTMQVRRLDENMIRISCFGITKELDLLEVRDHWEKRLEETKKELDHKLFGTLTVFYYIQGESKI